MEDEIGKVNGLTNFYESVYSKDMILEKSK